MNIEKEKKAIARLKAFEPEGEPYYICYSGGKDSDCIRILADLAGVKYELHYSVTSVDAPETVRYIKSVGNVIFDYPRYLDGKIITMWNLIPKKKMPPTRLTRYCCQYLKEQGGKGKMKVTGVRWAESRNRANNAGLIRVIGKEKTMQKKAEQELIGYKISKQGGLILNFDDAPERRFVESCYRTTSTMLNPIIDWSDNDVYEFLRSYGCEMNPLYRCGHSRVGCIGCPMKGGNGMSRDFAVYPKYKKNYIRAFDRMLSGMPKCTNWKTGKDVFKWWLGEDVNQLSFFDETEE